MTDIRGLCNGGSLCATSENQRRLWVTSSRCLYAITDFLQLPRAIMEAAACLFEHVFGWTTGLT